MCRKEEEKGKREDAETAAVKLKGRRAKLKGGRQGRFGTPRGSSIKKY